MYGFMAIMAQFRRNGSPILTKHCQLVIYYPTPKVNLNYDDAGTGDVAYFMLKLQPGDKQEDV